MLLDQPGSDRSRDILESCRPLRQYTWVWTAELTSSCKNAAVIDVNVPKRAH